MSAAATTSRTDDSLMRATARLAEPLGVVEREAVGHARDELRDRGRLVAALRELLDDPPDDGVGPLVLTARVRCEVDPFEHERAEREHSRADLVALPDVSGVGGRL